MPESALRVLVVAGGGALGATARYLLSGYIGRLAGTSYPWGTTSVNLVGALLFGVVWSLYGREPELHGLLKVFLLGGFLGAFTTFSTLAFETAQLLAKARPLAALINLSVQNFVGLALVFAGFAAGDFIVKWVGRL